MALAHLSQPKLLHGVGSPLAGINSSPYGHLSTLGADVAALHPEHVSEHLSFNRFQFHDSSRFAGVLLPPAQSLEGVTTAVANIQHFRAALGGIRIAVENSVSYLPPAPGEWSDSSFLSAVVEAADCGILLDLHNALCNFRNGHQNIVAFCEGLPLDRIWELHLAGGELEQGFYVDAHSGLVDPELMEIAATLVPQLPELRAIVFEIMPERVADIGIIAIGRQLGQLQDLWTKRSISQTISQHPVRVNPVDNMEISIQQWSSLLGAAVTGIDVPQLDQTLGRWWESAQPGIELYRMLMSEGRASAIAATLPTVTRQLLSTKGSAGARSILAEFWRISPRAYTSIEEAAAFIKFLSTAVLAIEEMSEAINKDLATLEKFCPNIGTRPPWK